MKNTLQRVLLGGLILSGIGFLFATYVLLTPSTYDAKGRVAGIDDGGRTLIVEHEEIPGYMTAMTMPLPADPSTTSSLQSGDAIEFELVVSSDSTWIGSVESLPDTAVARHPARATQPVAASTSTSDGPQPLREGDPVPADLTLVDQTGTPIQMGDFRGRALVLTFIYTSCPLPDYCPLMSKHFATLQPTLREKFGDRAHLLSISFDPATDTPSVLRDYAERYTGRLDTWTFVTGDRSQVNRATSLFQVYTKPEVGEITHNLVTAVVAPDGTVRRIFRGNDWMPEDVVKTVETTL
ncbi:SCO family protein [Salinibacter altiplanensis]|uniref:SCO family protein n=1 Tax=Salinibacter altiplanensis TaxID=1803181 RepID=UPI000C9EDF19|nr:SCO family protein [Salinibacter altiplanensis]